MTLTEARTVLKEQLAWMRSDVNEPEPSCPDSETLYEAMETAIEYLPKGDTRLDCLNRLKMILKAIADNHDGFDPFANPKRERSLVCWRHCIYYKLMNEGYHTTEIARATGYDHATIWWGVKRLKDYLEAGDYLAVAIWEDLNTIVK